MKTTKIMMAVAAFALATGNVEAKPQPKANPQPKTGTLIVYRQWHLPGAAWSLPFCLNGKLVAKLKNGYYYKLELPEGDYVLTHGDYTTTHSARGNAFFGIPPDPQKVHVTAGQTIYFCNFAVIMIGPVFEVAEDQNGARESVSHLQQQTSQK